VSCECCVSKVEVSASGWSLVQRSPTECGVSECDREASVMRRARPTRGCSAMGGGGRRGEYDPWYVHYSDVYSNDTKNDIIILKLVYMHSEFLCVSASHMAIFRGVIYTGQMHCLCIWHSWKWSRGWPKHVGVHCVYKPISVHLCALFVPL
jgi:hypothetical protein